MQFIRDGQRREAETLHAFRDGCNPRFDWCTGIKQPFNITNLGNLNSAVNFDSMSEEEEEERKPKKELPGLTRKNVKKDGKVKELPLEKMRKKKDKKARRKARAALEVWDRDDITTPNLYSEKS